MRVEVAAPWLALPRSRPQAHAAEHQDVWNAINQAMRKNVDANLAIKEFLQDKGDEDTLRLLQTSDLNAEELGEYYRYVGCVCVRPSTTARQCAFSRGSGRRSSLLLGRCHTKPARSGFQLREGGSIGPPKTGGFGKRPQLTGPLISCYELGRRRRRHFL